MKDYTADYMNYFYKTVVLDDGTEVVDWNTENSIYSPISNFFVDFSIAERSGTESIRNVFDKIIVDYAYDYARLTELVLVLESKYNYYAVTDINSDMCKFYQDLYAYAYSYVESLLRDDDDGQKYFYLVTDYGTEHPWLDSK